MPTSVRRGSLIAGTLCLAGIAGFSRAMISPCDFNSSTELQSHIEGSYELTTPDSVVRTGDESGAGLYSPLTGWHIPNSCLSRANFNDTRDACGTPGACDVGEPINPYSGAMYHDEIDIYSDSGLLPLLVSRRYYSGPRANTPYRKNSAWLWPEISDNPLTDRTISKQVMWDDPNCCDPLEPESDCDSCDGENPTPPGNGIICRTAAREKVRAQSSTNGNN